MCTSTEVNGTTSGWVKRTKVLSQEAYFHTYGARGFRWLYPRRGIRGELQMARCSAAKRNGTSVFRRFALPGPASLRARRGESGRVGVWCGPRLGKKIRKHQLRYGQHDHQPRGANPSSATICDSYACWLFLIAPATACRFGVGRTRAYVFNAESTPRQFVEFVRRILWYNVPTWERRKIRRNGFSAPQYMSLPITDLIAALSTSPGKPASTRLPSTACSTTRTASVAQPYGMPRAATLSSPI